MVREAVLTPAWQLGEGANDRFAFGAWEPMFYLDERFDRVMQYCLQTSKLWHPEKFVGWMLAEYSSREGQRRQQGYVTATQHIALRESEHTVERNRKTFACHPRCLFIVANYSCAVSHNSKL